MTLNGFATNQGDFQRMRRFVETQVNLLARLPEWPFKETGGHITLFEYDRVLGADFGEVLNALACAYDESSIVVIGIEPSASYYGDEYGLLPAFSLAPGRIEANYGAAMQFAPMGDPTGALGDTLDVLAMTGSSGEWSLFAQRDWEIALLLAGDEEGPWLATSVPHFARDIDLDSIRSPAGWGAFLSTQDRETFNRNMRDRGSGMKGPGPESLVW